MGFQPHNYTVVFLSALILHYTETKFVIFLQKNINYTVQTC